MENGYRGMNLEHFLIALAGLVALCVCAIKGHGEVASSIAIICVGANGGSAVQALKTK